MFRSRNVYNFNTQVNITINVVVHSHDKDSSDLEQEEKKPTVFDWLSLFTSWIEVITTIITTVM